MIADKLFKCVINNNPKDLNNILIQVIEYYKDFEPYKLVIVDPNIDIINKIIIFNKEYMYSEQDIVDECIEILNRVEPYKNKYKYKSKNLQIIANIKQKKTCHMKNVKKILNIVNQHYMKVIANDLSNIMWSLGKLSSLGSKNENIIIICNMIINIINSNDNNKTIFSDYNIDKIRWGLQMIMPTIKFELL